MNCNMEMWMSLVTFQVLGSHPDALGWGIICSLSPKELSECNLCQYHHILHMFVYTSASCILWLDISAMMLNKSRVYCRPLKFPHEEH